MLALTAFLTYKSTSKQPFRLFWVSDFVLQPSCYSLGTGLTKRQGNEFTFFIRSVFNLLYPRPMAHHSPVNGQFSQSGTSAPSTRGEGVKAPSEPRRLMPYWSCEPAWSWHSAQR